MAAPASPSTRNRRIDFLRGLAVLVVLFTHFSVCGPFTGTLFLPGTWLANLSRNGYYGVSAFFVISGFVITSTSLRRYGSLNRIRLGEFYTYRASRILPPLLLLVTLNLIGLAAGAPDFHLTAGISLGRLLADVFTFRFNFLYLQGGSLLLPWAPLWSLAIEEVFYLMFPLLCLVVRGERGLGAILAAAVLLGPLYRRSIGADSLYLYPGCFDLLALGCLTALLAARLPLPRWRPALGTVCCVGALVGLAAVYFAASIHAESVWVLGPSGVGLAAAVYLLGSAASPTPRYTRGVETMGRLSYELYLFHLPIFLLAAPVLGGHFPRDAAFLIAVVVLTAVCAAISVWISEPARRLLRRSV